MGAPLKVHPFHRQAPILLACGAPATVYTTLEETTTETTETTGTETPGTETSTTITTAPPSGTDTGTIATTRWSFPERPDTDSPGESDPWRYGGGVDYPDVADPTWPVVTIVDSTDGLLSALEAANPGEIVYIADTADIDLTDHAPVCVPEGIWLAGGRGVDGAPGGRVYVTESWKKPVLDVCGDDVRITGSRLIGADSDECPDTWPDACTGVDRTGGANCRDCEEASIGIQIGGYDRLEIDNMELAGWSYAATWFTDSVGGLVHHNHIHHTWRQGLGYGVVLTRGGDELVTVEIAWNRFDYNRHAVAGSGEPGQDYIAPDNLVLEHANGHVFDMHGENENTENGSEYAGGDLRIHRNTVLVPDQYALVVRGRPEHGSWLYDNCLARADADSAASQNYFEGNFHIDVDPDGVSAPNAYDQEAADCETVRWCTSAGAVSPWDHGLSTSAGLEELAFGDLDGDGRADALRTTGSVWEWSSGAVGAWAARNTSSYTLDSLALGDFDGDGADDVFRATGSEWAISSGGSGSWATLNTSQVTLSELAIADIDGDGRADALRLDGTRWVVSWAGTGSWEELRVDSRDPAALAFDDFDGDGRADALDAGCL